MSMKIWQRKSCLAPSNFFPHFDVITLEKGNLPLLTWFVSDKNSISAMLSPVETKFQACHFCSKCIFRCTSQSWDGLTLTKSYPCIIQFSVHVVMSLLGEASKKETIFLLLVKKQRPPSSPFFDHLSFFLIRIFWIGQYPLNEKKMVKNSVFGQKW